MPVVAAAVGLGAAGSIIGGIQANRGASKAANAQVQAAHVPGEDGNS